MSLGKVLRDKDFNLNDKQWILVSIDPERDTPEIINNYAKGFDKDFIGVSNTRPMLLSLATQLSVNNIMPKVIKPIVTSITSMTAKVTLKPRL